MRATILHNPRCGTSRTTLALLEAAGAQVTVIPYLTDTPPRAELARLYARAGLRPAEGLRASEPGAAALITADDDAVLDAMIADPILMQRPLVETDKGVRLCRPADRVREIL